MTGRRFRATLDAAEQELHASWKILASMKSRVSADLPKLQPHLAKALAILSKEHLRIAKRRKGLIEKKDRVSEAWFVRQQRCLAGRQKSLTQAAAIARSMGDAFAWFFYQNDRELLERHAAEPRQDQIPVGLGGVGERKFVESLPTIDGHMVLYHGVTTILRLGDVSLIDLERLRVSAIGELKTTPEAPDVLTVHATFYGSRHLFGTARSKAPVGRKPAKLSAPQRSKLQRQMKRIASALKEQEPSSSRRGLSFVEERHIPELARLVTAAGTRRFSYAQAGPGLLLVALRRRRRTLFSSLEISAPEKLPDFFELEKHALAIMLKSSDKNSIHIGSMFFDSRNSHRHILGTSPLFWWDLDAEALRRLYFQETIVTSIYNPAHLISALEGAGFVVSSNDGWRTLEVSRRRDNRVLAFQNFWYFVYLIADQLFSERQVVDTLERMATSLERENLDPNTKVELRFQHILHRPPGDQKLVVVGADSSQAARPSLRG